MKQTALFICEDPQSPHWQLGPLPPPAGGMMLLGWWSPDSDEGEVPEEVRLVLATALSSVATVTFPSTRSTTVVPLLDPGDSVIELNRGIGRRLNAFLTRRPFAISVISTANPLGVQTLFDDPGFPWWLQGQIALLSRRNEPVTLDDKTLEALISERWATATYGLEAQGIIGSFRPGVDGAVAAVFSLSTQVEQTLRTTIQAVAEQAGVPCLKLSEAEFVDRLAVGSA